MQRKSAEVNIGMIGGMINSDAYESTKIPLKSKGQNNQKKLETDYNDILDDFNQVQIKKDFHNVDLETLDAESSLDTLLLIAASAIIDNNSVLMEHTKKLIKQSQEIRSGQDLKFFESLQELSVDEISNFPGTVRTMMTMALKISIDAFNQQAVFAILKYSQSKFFTLVVEQESLEILIKAEAYSTMQFMISASVQIDKPKTKKSFTPLKGLVETIVEP